MWELKGNSKALKYVFFGFGIQKLQGFKVQFVDYLKLFGEHEVQVVDIRKNKCLKLHRVTSPRRGA